jgi:hypothetical protein
MLTDAERSYVDHMDWSESCAKHFKAAGYAAGAAAQEARVAELEADAVSLWEYVWAMEAFNRGNSSARAIARINKAQEAVKARHAARAAPTRGDKDAD